MSVGNRIMVKLVHEPVDPKNCLQTLEDQGSGFKIGDLIQLNPDSTITTKDSETSEVLVPIESFSSWVEFSARPVFSHYGESCSPVLYLGYQITINQEVIDVDHFFLHEGSIWVLPSYIQDSFFYSDEQTGNRKTCLKPWFQLAKENSQ